MQVFQYRHGSFLWLFEMSKSDNAILKQAGILAVAGIIVRIIGLLYKSPLTSIIGDEGNGYYNSAYNWYIIILMISSYSIPSAISKVMAQKFVLGEYKNAQKVFRCALIYVLVVGFVGTLIIFNFASLMVGNNGAYVLRVFAPTVFLYGPLGVIRGYFQAQKTMVPTSVSQVAEQLINAVISILAAFCLTNIAISKGQNSAIYGAAGSALGTGAGVVFALVFMTFVYHKNKKVINEKIKEDNNKTDDTKKVFWMIFTIVTPFLMSTFLYNITPNINQKLFYHILEMRGFDESHIAALYGIYAGKALTITNIPIALSSALASAMIPSISEKFIQGKKEESNRIAIKVIRVSMLIATPSALGLIFLARPITQILFPQRNSLNEAALLLAFLSVTVVFYSQSTITNSVLQGTGRLKTPVVNAVIALIVQTIVLVVLLDYSNLDNMCLVLTRVLYAFTMFLLNDIACRKRLKLKLDVKKVYFMPFLAALLMGIAGAAVHYAVAFALGGYSKIGYMPNLVASATAIVVSVFVYSIVLVKTNTLTEEDLMSFPKGNKIIRVFKKVRIL